MSKDKMTYEESIHKMLEQGLRNQCALATLIVVMPTGSVSDKKKALLATKQEMRSTAALLERVNS